MGEYQRIMIDIVEEHIQDEDGPDDEELQALEESNFWWTLGSFAEIVKEHGVRSVLGKLNKETEEKLFQYYYHQIKREE